MRSTFRMNTSHNSNAREITNPSSSTNVTSAVSHPTDNLGRSFNTWDADETHENGFHQVSNGKNDIMDFLLKDIKQLDDATSGPYLHQNQVTTNSGKNSEILNDPKCVTITGDNSNILHTPLSSEGFDHNKTDHLYCRTDEEDLDCMILKILPLDRGKDPSHSYKLLEASDTAFHSNLSMISTGLTNSNDTKDFQYDLHAKQIKQEKIDEFSDFYHLADTLNLPMCAKGTANTLKEPSTGSIGMNSSSVQNVIRNTNGSDTNLGNEICWDGKSKAAASSTLSNVSRQFNSTSVVPAGIFTNSANSFFRNSGWNTELISSDKNSERKQTSNNMKENSIINNRFGSYSSQLNISGKRSIISNAASEHEAREKSGFLYNSNHFTPKRLKSHSATPMNNEDLFFVDAGVKFNKQGSEKEEEDHKIKFYNSKENVQNNCKVNIYDDFKSLTTDLANPAFSTSNPVNVCQENKRESLEQEEIPSLFDRSNIDPNSNVIPAKKDTNGVQKFTANLWDTLFYDHNYFATQAECPDPEVTSAGKNDESGVNIDQSINCDSLSFDQNFDDIQEDKNSSLQSSQRVMSVPAEIVGQKSTDAKEISCDNALSTLDSEDVKQIANKIKQEDCLPDIKQTEFTLDSFGSVASESCTASVFVSAESPLFPGNVKMNFNQTSSSAVMNDKTSKISFPSQSVNYSENQAECKSAQTITVSNESKDNVNDVNNVYETLPQMCRNAYGLQALNDYSYDTLYQAKITDTKHSSGKNEPILQKTTNSNYDEQKKTAISCTNWNSNLYSKKCLSTEGSRLIPSTKSKQMEVARRDVFQMKNYLNNTNASGISRRPIRDPILKTPILSLFKKNKSESLAAISTPENISGPSTNIENRMTEVPDVSFSKAIKNTENNNYSGRSDQNLFLERKRFPDQQGIQENSFAYQSETDCFNAEKIETCNETIPLLLLSSFSTNKTFANATEEYITPTQCQQENFHSPEKNVSNKNQLPSKANASECCNLPLTTELQEIITLSSSSSISNSPADIFSNSCRTNNESRNSYNSLMENSEKTSHVNLNGLSDYSQVYETFYNTNTSSVRAQSVEEIENGQLNFQAQNALGNNTTVISHGTEPENCITYHNSSVNTGSRTLNEMCFPEEFAPGHRKNAEIISSMTERTETNLRPNFNSSVENYYSDSYKSSGIDNGKANFENAMNTSSFGNGYEQYLISSNHFGNNQGNYENLPSSETRSSLFNPEYFPHNHQPFPAKDGRYCQISYNSFQQKDLQNHITAYQQQQQQNQIALKPNLQSSNNLSSSNSVMERTVVNPPLSKQFTNHLPSSSTREVESSSVVIYEPISPPDIQEQPLLHRNVEECDRRLLHHSSGLLISGLSIAAMKKHQNNNSHVGQQNNSTPCRFPTCNQHWFNSYMSNVNGINHNRLRSQTANCMPLNLMKNGNVSINPRFPYSDFRQMPNSFNAGFTNGKNASYSHQMIRPAHFNNVRLSTVPGNSCVTLNKSGIQANECTYDRLGNACIPQTGNSDENFGSRNEISYRLPDVSRNQLANDRNQTIFPNTNYLIPSNASSASNNAFGATGFQNPCQSSAQSLRNGDRNFNPVNLQASINEYVPSNNVSQQFETQMDYSSYPEHPNGAFSCKWNDTTTDNNQFVNYDSIYQANQLSNKLDLLIDQENFEELESVLASPELTSVRHITIERAKAYIAFSKGNFKELFHILSQTQFPSKYHSGLQYLWEQGHCLEFQRMKGAPLKPVQRYRLKKRYPLPGTICAGSKGTSLREKARAVFSEVYLKDQHPSAEKRKMMAYHTGLTAEQVNTWFKNRRQRDRKRLRELQAEQIGNPSTSNETFSGGSTPVIGDYFANDRS